MGFAQNASDDRHRHNILYCRLMKHTLINAGLMLFFSLSLAQLNILIPKIVGCVCVM